MSVTYPRWLFFVYFSNILWSHLFYFILLLRIPIFNMEKCQKCKLKKLYIKGPNINCSWNIEMFRCERDQAVTDRSYIVSMAQICTETFHSFVNKFSLLSIFSWKQTMAVDIMIIHKLLLTDQKSFNQMMYLSLGKTQ